MTPQEFKSKLRKRYKADDLLNYTLCISLITLSGFLFYKIIEGGFRHKGIQTYLVLVSPFILLLLGVYGLWRIPRDYIVNIINSSLPVEKKKEIIDAYISPLKLKYKLVEKDYYEFCYQNRFWNLVIVKIFIDNNKILFNTQGANGSSLKDILDFGLTSRSSKKLERHLKMHTASSITTSHK